LQSSSDLSGGAKEEAYFVTYALKASRMKDWELIGELANKVAVMDELQYEFNETESSSSESTSGRKLSRQIEILMKENLKRKKY
jgi:hypothetical protein